MGDSGSAGKDSKRKRKGARKGVFDENKGKGSESDGTEESEDGSEDEQTSKKRKKSSKNKSARDEVDADGSGDKNPHTSRVDRIRKAVTEIKAIWKCKTGTHNSTVCLLNPSDPKSKRCNILKHSEVMEWADLIVCLLSTDCKKI